MDDHIESGGILVAVDGSESSIQALKYAARIAQALGAPLEVATVWSYPPFADGYISAQWQPDEQARGTLDDTVLAAFGDTPPDGLTKTVYSGPTVSTLIAMSETRQMLVLGSRGHGGFVGLLLGSVSSACAAHAKCPVLIVHPRDDAQVAVAADAA